MSATIEKRAVSDIPKVESRKDGSPIIAGYASLFNNRTTIAGMFTESVRPGAFTRALASSPDCRHLLNHDANYVLGRTKNGTLTLREDEKGLWTETTPPNTQQAKDVVENIRVGNIDQMSFAFTIDKQEWRMGGKGELDHREIVEIGQIYDISSCTFGAYPDTSVGLRSSEEAYTRAKAEWEKAKEIHGEKLQKIITRATEDGETVEVVVDGSVTTTVSDVTVTEDSDVITLNVNVDIPIKITTKEPVDAADPEEVMQNSFPVDSYALKVRCLRAQR
jgi:HK97 family phage prohead protease